MKFLKWLGIILLIVLALFLIIPLFLPSSFHIERSIIIEKPVSVVFKTATDMNLRSEWDPWLEMEPNAEMKITMNPEIVGSGYSWKGKIIGEGRITIMEFIPNEHIKSKIEFLVPQSMESDVFWDFEENNEGTKTTWAFEGTLSYPLEKWSGLFMDKFMGPQFEKGLSNFRVLVESLPDMVGKTGEISIGQFDGMYALTIKEECTTDKITGKMMEIYSSLMKYLKNNNTEISGSPFTIYLPSEKEGFIILECGLPVDKKIAGKDKITYKELPAGRIVTASHFGHFNTVKTTYEAIQNYITKNNLEINGSPWEIYITDPMKEPDEKKWETKVYFPIK